LSTIVFLDEIKWTATRRASPVVIDYLRTAHGTDIVCHTAPAFLSGEKIKKCAARSYAPKNASSLLPRKILTHKEVCQNRACIFTNDKNAHLVCVLYNMYLRGKTIVSCVLENSNSLRNQADMTIAHEKMSPEQQRIRCAVRAVGDGMKSSIFDLFTSKPSKKSKRPSPTLHRGRALRLFL